MKKLISLLLIMLIAFPCAFAEAENIDPNGYSGYWVDSWSGRAHMTITFDGERHRAAIHWANSAFAHVEWRMTGRFENGVFISGDCEKSIHSYDEEGTEEETTLYQNEQATLTFANGVITWTDSEGVGAECRFERYEDIDMRNVYNPEQYAHLYVTDIYSSADGSRVYCQGALGTIHENNELSGFNPHEALTLAISPDGDVRLPLKLTDRDSVEPSHDPAAWFDALDEEGDFGFYAILSISEAGEIVKLVYSEDQPDAPKATIPEETPVMIVPAPPTER